MARYRCVFIDPKGRTIVNVLAEDAQDALADARCRVAQERLYHRVEVWGESGLVLASGPVEEQPDLPTPAIPFSCT
jgi:hypothetical protein